MNTPLPNSIETDRLILRSYTASDSSLLFEVSQKNIAHWETYESGNIIFNIADLNAAEKIARILADEWTRQQNFFVGLFEKNSGKFVGQIYIGPQNQQFSEFELGYVADVEHEGKGFIHEALLRVIEVLFSFDKTQSLTIHCSAQNNKSANVALNCGFIQAKEKLEHETDKTADLTFILTRDQYINTAQK